MKIKSAKFEKRIIPFTKPVKVSFGIVEGTESYFITAKLEDGTTGFGEVANIEYITSVSNETIEKELEIFIPNLVGKDIENFVEIIEELNTKISMPSLCGIDMVLYDLASKSKGKSLAEFLNPNFVTIKPTNVTVGINEKETSLEIIKNNIKEGKTNIKVKVGANVDEDIDTINYILDNVEIDIRLDANQGWTPNDLDKFINGVDIKRIILIEEPFKKGEYDLLAKAKEKHKTVYLLADETCSTVQDAKELAKRNAVQGFNIKLIKCGGIQNALKINEIAKESGIESMLGCMGETKLALSAAAQLVMSDENFVTSDLDAFYFFKNDGDIQSKVQFNKTSIKLSEGTLGIGIDNINI